MRVTQMFAAAALALASTFAVAAATDSNAGAEQAIRKSLQNLELEVPVESVASSPLNGLYEVKLCLLYTSPSPRDATLSRMPSSA